MYYYMVCSVFRRIRTQYSEGTNYFSDDDKKINDENNVFHTYQMDCKLINLEFFFFNSAVAFHELLPLERVNGQNVVKCGE